MPLPSAVVVPITPVPVRVTFTVLFASAVPARIKVVSLVIPSLLEEPVSVEMPVMTGALGGVKSTTQVKLAGVASTFPAKSTVRACRV